MNVSLNGLFANYYNFVKDQLSQLTPLQRKVTLFALAFFSCATLGYLAYSRCNCFQAQRKAIGKNREEEIIPLSPDGEQIASNSLSGKNQGSGQIDSNPNAKKAEKEVGEKIFEEKEEPKIVDRKTDVQRRLEKNCKYAVLQQSQEKAKGFKIPSDKSINQGEWNIEVKQENVGKQAGTAYCQGIDSTIKSEIAITSISFNINGKTYQAEIFAVFDAGVGEKASAFAKANFAKYLTNAMVKDNGRELNDVGIWDALKNCCKKLGEDYPGHAEGTSAIFAMILENKIWIANAGDSRAFLVKQDKTTQASEDCLVNIIRYQKKIKKLGGWIVQGAIFGALAVARGIGYKNYRGTFGGKCCILSNPKITCYSLDDFKEGFLVLGSKSLYNVATTSEFGQAIKDLAGKEYSTDKIAEQLIYQTVIKSSQNSDVDNADSASEDQMDNEYEDEYKVEDPIAETNNPLSPVPPLKRPPHNASVIVVKL